MLELLEQQKKLTANQWKIAGAATLGDMLDFFDFFLIGFVLAFVVKAWHLNYGQSGAILLASGVSAPFGSLLYGWMADKVGRRTALITAVLNVSLATGAMALTPEGGWIYLVVCRFFVGFAVTGLYSVDITLMQEFSPAHKRGWFTGVTTTMLPAGQLIAALLGRICRSLYRLARDGCGRLAAGLPVPLYPCVRPRIAALAAAPRPGRRGAQGARLGIADGSSENRTAGRAPRDRKDPLARNLQIPAQHHRRLPHWAHPDRRRGARAVAGDAPRHGAEDQRARGLQADHLDQPVGDRRPVLLLMDLGCVGSPRRRRVQLLSRAACSCRWRAICTAFSSAACRCSF